MTKSIRIEVTPYPFWVTFINGSKEIKRSKKSGIIPEDWEDGEDEGAAFCYITGNHPHVLLGDKCDIYRLMHECVHALTYMYGYLGIPLNQDNDEVLAYHLEHLVSSAQAALKLPTTLFHPQDPD